MNNSTANENARIMVKTYETAVHICTEKRPYFCLFVLCGVLYFTWLNAEPLQTALEANSVQASWEMLHGGRLVPSLNDKPYLEKPPLHNWIICLFSLPWGEVTVPIARALSALSILLTAWLLYGWAKTQLNARTAFFACAVFALSPLVFELGPRAEPEAPLIFALASALFCLWKATNSQTTIRWPLLSGVALGCAALIHGPLPWLIFAPAWAGLMIGTSNRKRAAFSGAAAVSISLLGQLPWLLALYMQFGWQQLSDVFNWGLFSFTASEPETIQEPSWYYPQSLALGMLPWSLLAPGLYFLPWRSQQNRAFLSMLAGWAVGSALIFSLLSVKEAHYLISTCPAWALLLAWGWSAMPTEGWPNAYRDTMRFACVWMLPALIYLGALLVMAVYLPPTTYAIGYLFYGLLIIGVTNIGLSIRRNRPRWLLFAVLIALLGFKGFWSETYMKERQLNYPYAKIGREAAEYLFEQEALVSVGAYRAVLQYPVKHPFQHVDTWQAFKTLEADQQLKGRYLLITNKMMPLDAVHDYPLMNRWRTKSDEFLLFKLDGSIEP